MTLFGKIFGILTAFGLLVMPYLATERGWGVGTERNLRIIDDADCVDGSPRTADGRCQRSHRSYFRGRSFGGGGYGYGK